MVVVIGLTDKAKKWLTDNEMSEVETEEYLNFCGNIYLHTQVWENSKGKSYLKESQLSHFNGRLAIQFSAIKKYYRQTPPGKQSFVEETLWQESEIQRIINAIEALYQTI